MASRQVHTTPQSLSLRPPSTALPLRQASPAWPLALTALWVLVCFWMLRRAWLAPHAVRASGLHWEMLAALPAVAWAAALARGWAPELRTRHWLLLLAGAALVRLPLLPLAPVQSDDLYRYIWEGHIQWLGFNPFALAPDHPALVPYRDEIWRLMNHHHVSALYPPLAQWCFALIARLGDFLHHPVLVMKSFLTLCDFLTILVLGRWLELRGRSRAWAVLWAFHPLVIAEFSGNAHLDSLMVLLLAAALWGFDSAAAAPEKDAPRRAALALAALTAAALAKIIPLLLLPFCVWGLGRRRRWALAVPVAFGLAWLTYADAGWRNLLRSLIAYGVNWYGNAPAFDLIRILCFFNGYVARVVYLVGLLALMAVLWRRRTPPAPAALPVLGYYFVVGPMIHPWYLTAILPPVLAGHGRPGPWLWLTLTLPLVYVHQEAIPVWVRLVIWLPFWGWLGFNAFSAKAQRSKGAKKIQ